LKPRREKENEIEVPLENAEITALDLARSEVQMQSTNPFVLADSTLYFSVSASHLTLHFHQAQLSIWILYGPNYQARTPTLGYKLTQGEFLFPPNLRFANYLLIDTEAFFFLFFFSIQFGVWPRINKKEKLFILNYCYVLFIFFNVL